jgi:hypothetical protein
MARACPFVLDEGGHSVLFLAARYDPQRSVRQRPLQFERLGRVGREPKVDLFGRRQDNRHGLRMNRRDDPVGRGRHIAPTHTAPTAQRPQDGRRGRTTLAEGIMN